MQKVLETLILRYAKITKSNIQSFMKQDSFFDAQQTLKLGLVDHIIDKPSTLYKLVDV